MKQFVNYYSEKHFIYEAKFKGLNKDELAELDRIKQSILDNDYKAIKHTRGEIAYGEGIDKTIEYGNKYFVEFNNPFADPYKFSSTNKYNDPQKLENEPDVIQCIGIGDKFGRIFLQGIWDLNEPAYIEYKKAEKKTTKEGKTYMVEEGWYLTRKDIECYRVKTWKGKRGETPYHIPANEKTKGAWGININKKLSILKDLNTIPAEVKKYNDEILRKAEEADKLKKKEEEKKAFWDKVNKYKNYGMANTWDKTPEEVVKAHNDPDADWEIVNLGRCFRQYVSYKYKLTYSEDSSD